MKRGREKYSLHYLNSSSKPFLMLKVCLTDIMIYFSLCSEPKFLRIFKYTNHLIYFDVEKEYDEITLLIDNLYTVWTIRVGINHYIFHLNKFVHTTKYCIIGQPIYTSNLCVYFLFPYTNTCNPFSTILVYI